MRADVAKAIAYNTLSIILNKSDVLANGNPQIHFKGYTAEDLECEYCLHYGGKIKGCLIAECCCAEEKQQLQMAAKE